MKDYKTMYEEFKAKYPTALVMFHKKDWYTLNDWYTLYDEDAEVASNELNIPLQPAIGFKQCVDFPEKDLDRFLPKLVKNGHRIAIL